MKKLALTFLLFLSLIQFKAVGSQDSTKFELDTTVTIWTLQNHLLVDTFHFKKEFTLHGFQRVIHSQNLWPRYDLGNIGTSSYVPKIEQQISNTADELFPAISSYQFDPKKFEYYSTTAPNTILRYATGSKKEQFLLARHRQNFGRNLNISFDIKREGGLGYYSNQETLNSYFKLTTNYRSSNNRYHLEGYYFFQRLTQDENGGFENFTDILNPASTSASRLNTASNEFREEGFRIYQDLAIGPGTMDSSTYEKDVIPWITLGHEIEYSNQRHNFRDVRPDTLYYSSFFIDSTNTDDSLSYQEVKNTGILKFEVGNLDFHAGGFHNLLWLGRRYLRDTTFDDIGMVFGGKIDAHSFLVNADVEYTLEGFHSEDFNVSLDIIQKRYDTSLRSNSGLSAKLIWSETTPNHFFNLYRSNHYEWNQDMKKVQERKVKVDYLTKHVRGSVYAGQVDNLIYFNPDAVPYQWNSTMNYFSVELSKRLNFGKFHLNNLLRYQQSDAESVMPMPNAMIYESLYFQALAFKKILTYQLGFDVFYSSGHDGYVYNPVTYAFQVQGTNPVQLGNYPYVDFFANFSLKRARFYLKVAHINKGFSGNNYFRVVDYPQRPTSFHFGLEWLLFN